MITWLEKHWTRDRSRAGIIISLFVALVIYGSWASGWFELLERKSLDWRYRNFRTDEKKRHDIMILDIDEKSVEALKGAYGRFPWPRSVHGAMLQYLKECGARCVIFDVLFSEPTDNPEVVSPSDGNRFKVYNETNPSPDRELADATSMTGFVHHADEFTSQKNLISATPPEEVLAPFGLPPSREWYEFDTFAGSTCPLPELGAASRGIGSMNMNADPDGPVRKAYTFLEFKGKLFPSLSISALRQLAVDQPVPVPGVPESDLRNYICIRCGYEYDAAQHGGEPYSALSAGWSCPRCGAVKEEFAPPQLAPVRFEPGCIVINPAGPRTYRIPVDRHGLLTVNYYGDMHEFPYYSYYDLICKLQDYLNAAMAGETPVPSEDFRDKIIIVGSSAAGLMDLRATPYSSIYAGVEIHATLINNILTGDYQIPEPDWTHLVILLALAGLMGMIIPKRRALEGGLITILLMVLYIVACAYTFQHLNLAMDLVSPIFFIGGNFIILTGAGYMVEERKRRQVTGAFSQFVNPHVVQGILKDPEKLKLGGEKRDITVFFSDLAGFTTISESLPPEVMVKLLNEYLNEMAGVIFKYDGTVDKYIGDAVMAFWNAPLPQPDHAKRACWAALDQLARLDELRPVWRAQGYPDLNARMGINTGDIVVGLMGSANHKNYTVIADAVNLAARLEPANKTYGTRLMISESTYEEAKEFIEVRRLDAMRAKGKTQAVGIYELMAKKNGLALPRMELVQQYNVGMEHYLNQRWESGIKSFTRALELDPADGPSQVYLKRCRHYLANPPGEGWDGVYEQKDK